jgi:hypothetical protein
VRGHCLCKARKAGFWSLFDAFWLLTRIARRVNGLILAFIIAES